MRYVNLNEPELKTLQECHKKHSKHHVRQRCQALLLSHEGMRVPAIAKVIKTRTRTIYTWMNRWEQMGLAGLGILPGRGLKPQLCEKDTSVVALLKKS